MVVYSPPLALVVWLCFVPLFVIIRKFQGIVGRAYTKVRERVGDMLQGVMYVLPIDIHSRRGRPRRGTPDRGGLLDSAV